MPCSMNRSLSPPDPVTGVRPVLVRAGNSLGVNPWTLAVNAQYDFNAWGHNSYVRADDQFASRQSNPTPSEDPGNETYAAGLVQLPQTNLLSLRLGTRFSNGIDLSLFVKNVFDSHPILNRDQTGSNIDTIYVDRTFRPRTIGITITSRHWYMNAKFNVTASNRKFCCHSIPSTSADVRRTACRRWRSCEDLARVAAKYHNHLAQSVAAGAFTPPVPSWAKSIMQPRPFPAPFAALAGRFDRPRIRTSNSSSGCRCRVGPAVTNQSATAALPGRFAMTPCATR